jgi:phosphinothricin acetyltransferase
MIRKMHAGDGQRVLQIYRQGLETRNATFETEVPDWKHWDLAHHEFCRFVYAEKGEVLGWGALSALSKRSCYKGVAEISVYIDTGHLGQGIGSKLMKAVIDESEKNGIWTLYASIFPENVASHKLHLRHGFREIGIRERIAQLDGIWRDTLILERRSQKVGA